MKIGYLPEAGDAADKLKKRGYDVSEYDQSKVFDVLLYSGQMAQTTTFTDIDPTAPMFLLNTMALNDEELDRQVNDRTYSKLFE